MTEVIAFEDLAPIKDSSDEYPIDDRHDLPTSIKVAIGAAMINPILALPALGWWAAKQFSD